MISAFWIQLKCHQCIVALAQRDMKNIPQKVGVLGVGMMGAEDCSSVSAISGMDVVLKDVSIEARKGKAYSEGLLKKRDGRED